MYWLGIILFLMGIVAYAYSTYTQVKVAPGCSACDTKSSTNNK